MKQLALEAVTEATSGLLSAGGVHVRTPGACRMRGGVVEAASSSAGCRSLRMGRLSASLGLEAIRHSWRMEPHY
jgi:hypothetical protein